MNPGYGGWAAIVEHGGKEMVLHGWERHTTNNRMELVAVIAALCRIAEHASVHVYSDSQYVVQGGSCWMQHWHRSDWATCKKNRDLWRELYQLCADKQVKFHWIRGHSGNVLNERCNAIAEAIAAQCAETHGNAWRRWQNQP